MSDHEKSIAAIRKSGLLNPKMTLDELMDVSSELSRLNPGDLAAWTFISPDYVYKGDAAMKGIEDVIQR